MVQGELRRDAFEMAMKFECFLRMIPGIYPLDRLYSIEPQSIIAVVDKFDRWLQVCALKFCQVGYSL